MTDRSLLPLWRRRLADATGSLGAWCAGLVLLAVLAWQALGWVSSRLIAESAEATAIGYASYVARATPRLDDVFARRPLAPATREQLLRLRSLGEVFRFKLFDRAGHLVLVSDQLDQADPSPANESINSHHDVNRQVGAIVLGGRNFIEVKDGRGKADRPPVYVEAYVPLVLDGRVTGVVEVYVDQTALQQRTQRAFGAVGGIVTLLMLLLGGGAAVQVWKRSREKRLAADRMRYLAEHDVLSGALNRASFDRALKQAAWRHGEGGPGFGVLCIDLDRFKDVNDSLGHAAGDALLRQATERLRATLRHGDQLARLGGDEFAVLQSDVAGPEDMVRLADRVVQALAEPYDLHGHPWTTGASVGAARFGVDATTVDDLMHKADSALYRAKAAGRGRYQFFDVELDRVVEERRELARDLRRALSDGTLSLHYQPLFEAASEHPLIGYEALMRWTHPTRGPIAPAVFIPLAEETGQIEKLGAWALEQACQAAAGWPHELSVSVNLSALQFRGQGDLVRTVTRALDQAGLPARRLVLEVTESLLMSNTDTTVRTLEALAAMGCPIAMDDFGTGYSSLAYLWRFPFTKLKIDREFTQGLQSDAKVALIVRSIVTLAHSMGMRVNAEGIETATQLGELQRLGCDELQGFLLGHPVPVEQLAHQAARQRETAPAPVQPPRLEDIHTLPAPL